MADEIKPIGVDVTGNQILTTAIKELLAACPALEGEAIPFEELGEDGGLAFSADSGALIISERRSITDHVYQSCQFPFFVICRTSATREHEKLRVQEFLDLLGKWLCKEPVIIDGKAERLTAYPKLTDGRQITRITRSNSYGLEPNENNTQDWLLPVTVQYTNEFDMW